MLKIAVVTLCAAITFAAPASAANADAPHQNVDNSNDAGNGTGNAKVESLNRGQLDENQKGSGQGLGTSQPSQSAPVAH